MSKVLQIDRDFSGGQTIGSRREQQDSYAFSVIEGVPELARSLMLVIADGMGGYLGGKEAGSVAVQGCINGFFAAWKTSQGDGGFGVPLSGEEGEGKEKVSLRSSEVLACLENALGAANSEVTALIARDPLIFEQSGTTLVAAVVSSFGVRWVSVGDSPLFLWRNGELMRLNEDHSMRSVLALQVAEGELRAEELKTHPQRNMLTSAVCGGEIELFDLPEDAFFLEEGDILLAASDGVLTLEEEVISGILETHRERTASEIVAGLLDAVKEAKEPRQDNTTVAVVKW